MVFTFLKDCKREEGWGKEGNRKEGERKEFKKRKGKRKNQICVRSQSGPQSLKHLWSGHL